jgi:hypothetical protein
MSTTLLSINSQDPTYDDQVVTDHDGVQTLYFDGQKSGGRDHMIKVGSLVITKKHGLWVYVGFVMNVYDVEKVNDVRRFFLVVEKISYTGTSARTKKLLMEKLGWVLTDDAPGIATVTRV